MATIKVFFKDKEALKDGQYSIFLRVTQERNHKYIKIGTSLKEHWDYDKNLPHKKHPLYRELILSIKSKELDANKLIMSLENEDKDFSADQLRQSIKATRKKVSVFNYFDSTVKKMKAENRLGYADVFNSTAMNLKKYRDNKDFHFSEVDQNFINGFIDFLEGQGVKDNSKFVYLRTFKTLVNYARNESIVKESYNPFKEISFKKYRKIKTNKRAIQLDKTEEIESLELEIESRMWHSKNYYLFSYYTMGTNFVDLAHLKWDSIQNDNLVYTRAKTKKEYKIPLNPKAKDILAYYRKHKRDCYVFPILTESIHQTHTQKRDRIKKVNTQLNSDLNQIGKSLNLDLKLTSYVARHTAATTLKRSGQSIGVIKELMGHDSERTTEIYLDELDPTILQNAVNSL